MTWLNWPNRITIARIILVVPLVICLLRLNTGWVGWRHLSLALVVLMAASDALDGYLARRLGEETSLGRFLDPVGDKLLIACAVVLLAAESTAVPDARLPSWVPVIAIGKDVLTIIGFALIFATTGEYFVQPRAWGKACTLVQLLLIVFCLATPDVAPVLHHMFVPLCWLASGLAIIAAMDYLRIGNRFASSRAGTAKP